MNGTEKQNEPQRTKFYTGCVMSDCELGDRVKRLIAAYGYRELERMTGINRGIFHRVVRGQPSPHLRKTWGIVKYKPRIRLNIDTDRNTIDWFKRECKQQGLSRHDMLIYLLGKL